NDATFAFTNTQAAFVVERARETCRKTTAADRTMNALRNATECFDDLEAERRAIAGDHIEIVIRRKKRQTTLRGDSDRFGLRRVVTGVTRLDDGCACLFDLVDLRSRRAFRYDDLRFCAQHFRRMRDAHSMIACARGENR